MKKYNNYLKQIQNHSKRDLRCRRFPPQWARPHESVSGEPWHRPEKLILSKEEGLIKDKRQGSQAVKEETVNFPVST